MLYSCIENSPRMPPPSPIYPLLNLHPHSTSVHFLKGGFLSAALSVSLSSWNMFLELSVHILSLIGIYCSAGL